MRVRIPPAPPIKRYPMVFVLYDSKGVKITCKTEKGILLTFTSKEKNIKKVYKLCVNANGISCKRISESVLHER